MRLKIQALMKAGELDTGISTIFTMLVLMPCKMPNGGVVIEMTSTFANFN